MTRDRWQDPEIRAWLARSDRELKHLMRDADYVMLLLAGEPGAKQAVEVGFALLMGKPIILCATHGEVIPEGLRRAADAVVENVDLLDMEATQARVTAAFEALIDNMEEG